MPLTYEFKIDGRTIGVHAQKDMAEQIIRRFQKLTRIHQYIKEISGVIGGEEHSSVLYTLFSPSGFPVQNEPEFKNAVAAFASSLPEVLTPQSAVPFIEQADAIFNKHIPVKDTRKTPEQIAESNARGEQFRAELKSKQEAWEAQWCKPGGTITVPEGKMAVYLQMTYDDSDSMTDYFSPHASIGPGMLLGMVSRGPKTEKIARHVLAKYPDLAKLNWKWNVENYSMGHGNYLQSDWTDHKEPKHGYDGREEVTTRWEIEFWSHKKEFDVYKDYPGNVGSSPTIAQEAAQVDLFDTPATPTIATIQRNERHNGIEVTFSEKPDTSIIEGLKAMGFRWSGRQSLWYCTYSQDKLTKVKDLLNIS